MSGFYQMARRWQDNDVFTGAYSERDAWVWLIEAAAWKPTTCRIKGQSVPLGRGDLSFSQRFLADKWGWSKSRVDRFMHRLLTANMIFTRSKIGATAGHSAGQGQSIVTICNYDKYQSPKKQQRGNDGTPIGATAGQQRGKEEEGNKGIRKEASKEACAFDAFWRAYPRRTAKLAAQKAYASAINRGADPNAMTAAAQSFADSQNRDPQFTPHPATWLNQGRYDDQPEDIRNGQSPRKANPGDDLSQALARRVERLRLGGRVETTPN